jgi:protein-S-isoprenylcysteine O-methyltransferase Ste14
MNILATELFEITRLYLAVFYSIVAVFYIVRIIFLKRQTSAELIFPGERFCSTWWNHMAFRAFRDVIWLVCVLRLFFPSVDSYLVLFTPLITVPLLLLGLVLLTLGFLFNVTTHLKLGTRWRSGIDPSGPEALVTGCVYQFSRNPMFVGVAVSQLGFFFTLPCMFSLVCLLVGIAALYRQTLAEEEHLSQRFPIEYSEYCSKVRRWI